MKKKNTKGTAIKLDNPNHPLHWQHEYDKQLQSTNVEELWLIWSLEHHAWWKAGRSGYTTGRLDAGRYSFTEACEIVYDANRYQREGDYPKEAMIRDEANP